MGISSYIFFPLYQIELRKYEKCNFTDFEKLPDTKKKKKNLSNFWKMQNSYRSTSGRRPKFRKLK